MASTFDVAKVIFNILSSDGNVNGFVGTNIYPFISEQTVAFPCIVYEVIAATPTNRKDGTSAKDRFFTRVSAYSDKETSFLNGQDEVAEIADHIRTALDGKNGTYATIKVEDIRFENISWATNSQDKFYQVDQDFMISINN